MTVSPQWPQDGNGPQRPSESGGDPEDRLRSPALPPTLFKLPDLDAAAEKVKQASSNPPAQEGVQTSGPVEPVADASVPSTMPPAEPVAERPNTIERPSHLEQPSAPGGSSMPETSAANESVPDRSRDCNPGVPRRETTTDRPAGRSWMETIGSHGVVVVLLLVVVAAALISGRGSDLEEESNLADYGEMLDFDSGTEVDLPLPAFHGAESSAQLALNDDNPIGDTQESSQPEGYVPIDSGRTPESAGNDHVSLKALAESASVDYSTKSSSSVGAVPTAPAGPAAPNGKATSGGPAAPDQAIASLSEPYSTAPAPAPAADGSTASGEGGPATSGVRVNEFVGGSNDFEVLSASNRTEAQATRTTLPSLEDLATQPANDQGSVQAGVRQPIKSKTPLGFNLNNYLPAPDYSVPAIEETPATSN